MARTLTEIYSSAVEARNKYLQRTEYKPTDIENTSKMSVLDAFTATVSMAIWSFENLLDVFKIDIARDIMSRVNGTPTYYTNALLKYQKGYDIEVSEDGTQFSYSSIVPSARIITRVAYEEVQEPGFYDKQLLFKVATGDPGAYQPISAEELVSVKKYLSDISFAGTHTNVISRKGDILIPKVTVYYDGKVSTEEVYQNIRTSLSQYIKEIPFNGRVYEHKIIDAISNADHVVDVYIDKNNGQGIFVARYDDDEQLINNAPLSTTGSYIAPIGRTYTPSIGYLVDLKGELPGIENAAWDQNITLVVEK